MTRGLSFASWVELSDCEVHEFECGLLVREVASMSDRSSELRVEALDRLERALLDLAASGRATDVERTHRQLRARFADRLRGNHAHRLAGIDQATAAQVAAVATGADAEARCAGQRRAHLDLVDAGGFEAEVRQAFANLAAVAEEAGASLGHAVKLTLFLTDLDRARVDKGVGYVHGEIDKMQPRDADPLLDLMQESERDFSSRVWTLLSLATWADAGANIVYVSMERPDEGPVFNMFFSVQVRDRKHLANVMRALHRIPLVKRVQRART